MSRHVDVSILKKDMPEIIFSPEQVKLLCGGELPESGFAWETVVFFKFEDGCFEPYSDLDPNAILPGPSIKLSTKLEEF